jgi:hypothetical protein
VSDFIVLVDARLRTNDPDVAPGDLLPVLGGGSAAAAGLLP